MAISVGIVGGGVSGLALGYRLRAYLEQAGVAFELVIYEKSPRVGGAIRSEQTDGFVVEWGPNGFLNNEPATFSLIQSLGIRGRLSVSNDSSRKRFLLINGKLEQVPISPGGFIKTGILPISAKLRFALEPLIPQRTDSQDESVAGFVARRFGPKTVSRMFDPLMSGIYAGNVHALSINSTLKVFAAFEREHGSVVKGMFARIKQRKAEESSGSQEKVDELVTTSKNPMSGKLLSFRNGMGELIDALETPMQAHIKRSVVIEAIHRDAGRYEIAYRGPEGPARQQHDILIVTTPPSNAAELVTGLDPALGGILRQIESSTAVMIALGFQAADIAHPLDGFGYLIPREAGLRSLGVLWSSSIFENRAPAGHKLLQIVLGGAHDLHAVDVDDQALIDTAMKDAGPVLGIKGEPVMTRVIRHHTGIPQYTLGHQARLEQIAHRLKDLPGFHLAGNGYHGISTNDCIRTTNELAARIAEGLA